MMSFPRRLAAASVVAVALLASVPAAHGGFVSIGASKDNTLYEHPEGIFSNGAGEGFFAGRNALPEQSIRRGLLGFDIAGNVPAGATIESVTLQLHMSMTSSGFQDVSLHRVLSDWGEGISDAFGGEGGGANSTPGDATWLHTFYDDAFWTNPGGDFVAAPSATQSIGLVDFYTWSSPEMVDDVQFWLDSPSEAFGWELLGNEAEASTAKRFDSREHPTLEFRPVLMIQFATPGPGSIAVLGVAVVIGFRRPRRRRA